MKYVVSLLLVLTLLSCDKGNRGGYASAEANGKEFVSQSGSFAISSLQNDSLYSTKTTVILNGSRGERIEIYFPGEEEGVFNLGFDITPYAIYFDGSNTIYNSVSGVLNITNYNQTDNLLFGTFSFQGQSDIDGTIISIENGQFSEIPKVD